MYEPFANESDLNTDDSWFVYLLRSADCTAFKVGFTCNPLQRLHSFNPRYFEGCDLYQSWLLQLRSCEDAREVEAALKAELAPFRNEAPAWVADAAGGYTEWFGPMHFAIAEARLRTSLQTHEGARVLQAAEIVREHLRRYSASFEGWACAQAQLIAEPRTFAVPALAARQAARSLRDWLDAYRYFAIDLFVEDPSVLKFVRDLARSL